VGDLAGRRGRSLLPLGPEHLTALEAQGFRRALIEKSRYPSLPADIPAVDYSGWPIYCRADTRIRWWRGSARPWCAGGTTIPWDIGGVSQPPLPLERMVRESPVTPLDVPLHPQRPPSGGSTESSDGPIFGNGPFGNGPFW